MFISFIAHVVMIMLFNFTVDINQTKAKSNKLIMIVKQNYGNLGFNTPNTSGWAL